MEFRTARPWHLWPVGLLALFWHGAGALDYLLSRLSYAAYTSRLPGAWVVWADGLPAWVTGLWAVAVWGGFLGAVLLLMRERGAVLVFAGAALAMAGAAVVLTWWVDPALQQVAGPVAARVVAGATLALFVLWLYARQLKIGGVLD